MASKGSACWTLPYPQVAEKYGRTYSTDLDMWRNRWNKNPWRKFINLCKMLRRTKVEYECTFIDMGEHMRVLVSWTTPRSCGR